MTKTLYVAGLLAAFLVLSGGTCHVPIVPVVVPGDVEKCPAACEHLRALSCPEGLPLEDGTSCEDFCVYTQKNGQPLNPSCIVGVKACSEVGSCTNAK